MIAGSLPELRTAIDAIDTELIAMIGERIAIARRVGAIKGTEGLPVMDPAREAAVVSRAARMAREAGLPEDEIRALFWQLIAITRRAQASAS
ncbi:MAG: chorismate mutase [Gemmatimonadota bacterium]